MTDWPMMQFLDLAKSAAVQAGEMLMLRPPEIFVESKSTPTDAVTQMDRRSEAFLSDMLLTARPNDGILGEEGATRAGSSQYRWVVDPIDGTVNYLYDLPGWSVCVGLERDGEPVVGAVAVPSIGVTYFGALGLGSYRAVDGKEPERLAVSAVDQLDMALTGTGFGYAVERRTKQAEVAAAMLPRVRDLRRFGSAAVDICFVASGQLDAYYEKGLNPWDFTAAAVIAREAGAIVGGVDGGAPDSDLTMAANPALFGQLHDQLKSLGAQLSDGIG